jgi:hypothetical protein
MIVLSVGIEHSIKPQLAGNVLDVDVRLISQEASSKEVVYVTIVVSVRFSSIKVSKVVGIVVRSIHNPSC